MQAIIGGSRSGLLAYRAIDVIAVAAALGHFALIVAWLMFADRFDWWQTLAAGLAYAYALSWSVNGLAHNFIHTRYFRSEALNRAFSVVLSLIGASSQQLYAFGHGRHHLGNMDRPGADGATLDPISIYRHGKSGQAESAWSYALKAMLRDRPVVSCRALWSRNAVEGRWAARELAAIAFFYAGAALCNWQAVALLLPFYYVGRCLSALNGYYEHYRADPDTPIAWGVSSYHRLYNLLWFNNGYHAEHHFRPRLHWTQLPQFHAEIADRQRRAGVRQIDRPHYLGFLVAP